MNFLNTDHQNIEQKNSDFLYAELHSHKIILTAQDTWPESD